MPGCFSAHQPHRRPECLVRGTPSIPARGGQTTARRLMMRKTSLVLLGAVAGAALTLLISQPRVLIGATANAASAADAYRHLNLFGDVFERVRLNYVEKPDESKLVESAINGMLQGLDPHSSYMDPKSF